jgi:hypothetical protein
MSKFGDAMARSNAVALREFGDMGIIDGVPILMDVDTTTSQASARQGGKTQGFETLIFVDRAAFVALGGKKGSIVTLDEGECQVIKIDNERDGIVQLQCGPFKPIRV